MNCRIVIVKGRIKPAYVIYKEESKEEGESRERYGFVLAHKSYLPLLALAASSGNRASLPLLRSPLASLTLSNLQMNEWDKKFYLGLGILFAWCIVMALCASPQLFRDKIVDILCCQPGESRRRKEHLEKLKTAHERAKTISMSCGAMTGLVTRPSQILVAQAVGPIWNQSILETDHETSYEPCIRSL